MSCQELHDIHYIYPRNKKSEINRYLAPKKEDHAEVEFKMVTLNIGQQIICHGPVRQTPSLPQVDPAYEEMLEKTVAYLREQDENIVGNRDVEMGAEENANIAN